MTMSDDHPSIRHLERLDAEELLDPETEEEWVSEREPVQMLRVSVWKPRGQEWRVTCSAFQFLRDTLELQVESAVHNALAGVEGADEVIDEDRGQWIIVGSPAPDALAGAAGHALDEFAPQLMRLYAGLRQ
jgi:hypothetical protein